MEIQVEAPSVPVRVVNVRIVRVGMREVAVAMDVGMPINRAKSLLVRVLVVFVVDVGVLVDHALVNVRMFMAAPEERTDARDPQGQRQPGSDRRPFSKKHDGRAEAENGGNREDAARESGAKMPQRQDEKPQGEAVAERSGEKKHGEVVPSDRKRPAGEIPATKVSKRARAPFDERNGGGVLAGNTCGGVAVDRPGQAGDNDEHRSEARPGP